ncbi:hypothetical protein QJS10_CPA06g01949 [Acorus calamus]|uniref:Leucine-rich repeat-containing N-terminal plant-type domain-containing protein n=1 Tax=Acorus calamus TaxID=4465 RepID=A0AAV9EJM9_ACOCL|nr:hypothetical protein QJS10_CPA06g01949 [Acorus calamus]
MEKEKEKEDEEKKNKKKGMLVGYNSTALEDWVIGGRDCCNWTGVTCGNSSYHHKVILIHLYNVREGFIYEEWYPNGSHFGQFMELEGLDLNSNGIAGWVDPQGFMNLQNLKTLELGDNHIKRVDPWILNITSLELIWMASNMIEEFPSGFWGMQNLQDLYLQENDIMRVHPSISNITSLEVIDLDLNMFKEFPSDALLRAGSKAKPPRQLPRTLIQGEPLNNMINEGPNKADSA